MSVIITQQRRGRLNVYHVKNIDEAGVLTVEGPSTDAQEIVFQ